MTFAGDENRDVGRAADVALREIREAEASRMLGLLDADPLDAHAAGWLADGVDSPALRSLARSGDSGAAAVKLALLAEAAAELGLSFRGVQDARGFHIRATMSDVDGITRAGQESFSISNAFTDQLSSTALEVFRSVTKRLKRRNP
jgi:hypothetical protein